MLRNRAHIKIGQRCVGDSEPFFVIAEIGLNHGGAVDRALQMVDAAADAGVSAIKLQTLDATKLVAPDSPAPAHVKASSLSDFFSTFELDEAAHLAVFERARARGLVVMSTPFSLDAVDMLDRLGVDAFKIASGDITWDGLIEKVASKGKPIVISTGMATIDEVSHAVATARLAGAFDIALLHCVSAYPVPRGSENLSAIATLGRAFETPVGLSDHAPDTFSVPMAIAFGASLYERHMILDGDSQAIDAPVSSTPKEFAAAIAVAARAQDAIGSGEKRCEPAERPNLPPSRRGLYAARHISAGDIINADDVVALRPALGVPANDLDQFVGQEAQFAIPAGSALAAHHLVAPTLVRRSA